MRKNFITIFSTLILLVGTLAIVFLPEIIKYGNNQTIEITIIDFVNFGIFLNIEPDVKTKIKDKYVKNGKSGDSSKYLVVDEDNNTYEVTDLFLKGKFNSTDLYNILEIGHTYRVETSGSRIRLLSMYPNINKVIKECEED